MWISKKKWNILCSQVHTMEVKLCNYKELKDDVYKLTKIHKKETVDEPYFDCTPYRVFDKKHKATQYTHATSTDTIPNVTLKELARYVIDNEPIVREETINIKKEYR